MCARSALALLLRLPLAGRGLPCRRGPCSLLGPSRDFQPGLDQGGVGLGVEEDPPGVADAEGLVLGQRRGGERVRALGQVEDVAVPVQDVGARGQAADDRVGRVVDVDVGEADLRPSPGLTSAPSARASSCAPRQMPSTGISRRTASASHSRSVGQRRVGLDVVDVHRPAHRDHPVDLVVVRQRLRRPAASTSSTSDVVAKASRIRCGFSQDACMRVSSVVKSAEGSRATVRRMPKLLADRDLQARGSAGDRDRPPGPGAVAIGALAVGAAAVGGFAIGRLSVGRLSIGRAEGRPARGRRGRDRPPHGPRPRARERLTTGRVKRSARLAARRRGWLLVRGADRRARPPPSAPTPTSAAARSSPTRPPRSPPTRALRRPRAPGTRTSRRRRSPPTRRRRSPTSTPTAATSSTPTSARPAPTASPTRWSAPASPSCRSTTPPTATRATRGRSRSPPAPRSRAAAAATATATCSSSTARACTPLRALPRLPRGRRRRRLERRLGHRLGPALDRPPSATAAPRPTPPACRSSPAWSATTRSPPASSNTRSGSPSRAPATPGSTPPRTAPATPTTRTRRRWAPACGSRPATASAASAAAPR